MANRAEFITVVNTLKTLSQTITDEQRKGLLQRAVQEHGLSVDEASEILNASGLVVGARVNYFEVLEFSIDEFENQSEGTITTLVDVAHNKFYTESLRAGGLPRPDGRTQEQWRTLLNQARDTLKDPQKRVEHIATLQTEIAQPVDPILQEEFPISEPEEITISEQTSLSVPVPKDMVLIPAGEFQIGNDKDRANNQETPMNAVYVDTFCIDKYPVTNAQYKKFIDVNPQWCKPSKWDKQNRSKKKILSVYRKFHGVDYLKNWNLNNFPVGKADHPVTHVSWYAAMAYAEWAGKRLPTEAEWEKAARGGVTGQKYPWGDFLDSNYVYCGKNVGETTSVGKYPANNYGLHDIVGNVWEWCLDEYSAIFYTSSLVRNPIAGTQTKEDLDLLKLDFRNVTSDRVLRGGTLFASSEPNQMAARLGGSPFLTTHLSKYSTMFAANIGFRCAWDARLKSKSL